MSSRPKSDYSSKLKEVCARGVPSAFVMMAKSTCETNLEQQPPTRFRGCSQALNRRLLEIDTRNVVYAIPISFPDAQDF